MEDRTFMLIMARLDRIENKVDKLMTFRGYIMGIAAVCGLIGASIFRFIRGF